MIGVAAHFWNGLIIFQAPTAAAPLARIAAAQSGRAVGGLIGPWTQVEEAQQSLGLGKHPMRLCSREDLFSMQLADLVHPSVLGGSVVSRRADRQDLDALLPWRVAYAVEVTGAAESPDLWATEARVLERQILSGDSFLLEADGQAVSSCGFNARIPEMVQIGGVWTPPELRGRGYARAVVAGALQTAASEGVTRAVLFTGESNTPAQRAYQGLGFRRVGDYGIVLFASKVHVG
jgi:RimJ/RimL family protein N-acetyltransferase